MALMLRVQSPSAFTVTVRRPLTSIAVGDEKEKGCWAIATGQRLTQANCPGLNEKPSWPSGSITSVVERARSGCSRTTRHGLRSWMRGEMTRAQTMVETRLAAMTSKTNWRKTPLV